MITRISAGIASLSNKKMIEGWRLKALLKHDRVFIYDLRDKKAYDEAHILGSWNIDPIQIKDVINKHSKKSIVVLYYERDRTFLPIVTWAKKNKKAKVFVIRNSALNKYKSFIYSTFSEKKA